MGFSIQSGSQRDRFLSKGSCTQVWEERQEVLWGSGYWSLQRCWIEKPPWEEQWCVCVNMNRLPHTWVHVKIRGQLSSHFSLPCFQGRVTPASVAVVYSRLAALRASKQFFCLHLPSGCKNAGITDVQHCIWLFTWIWGPNLGHQVV